MRHRVSCSILLALSLLSLAGCNSQGGRSAQTDRRAEEARQSIAAEATPRLDGVRVVTIQEARAAVEKGEAVLVDVRGTVEYELGHIKGALSVPLGLVVKESNKLPRDKMIITYCACTHEQLSARAVQEMKTIGIENAAALGGGWDAWVAAGLPAEIPE